jgi:hypothetical protein
MLNLEAVNYFIAGVLPSTFGPAASFKNVPDVFVLTPSWGSNEETAGRLVRPCAELKA